MHELIKLFIIYFVSWRFSFELSFTKYVAKTWCSERSLHLSANETEVSILYPQDNITLFFLIHAGHTKSAPDICWELCNLKVSNIIIMEVQVASVGPVFVFHGSISDLTRSDVPLADLSNFYCAWSIFSRLYLSVMFLVSLSSS